MGAGSFDTSSYRSFSNTISTKSVDDIYNGRKIHKDLDPKGITFRESRDSVDNPQSTPVIVALDVTGSMGMIADNIVREGLGTLFEGILDRKPISNPHLMFMGVGDANCDKAPLQVSQFEADNRIVEQLTKIYLEHGGGGNNYESYNLPWYFASQHTVHDSFEKRAKRGYLFTIGDEEAPRDLTKDQIKEFIGDTVERLGTTEDILNDARRTYDVYHVVIKQGSHAKRHLSEVMDSWRNLLGQRVLPLDDYKLLAQTIVSAIDVAEGTKAADSAARWGRGASVIESAVRAVPVGRSPKLLEKGGN